MRKRKQSPIPPYQVRREDILKEETPETPETSAEATGREDVLRRGARPKPAGRQDVMAPLIRRRRRQDVLRES